MTNKVTVVTALTFLVTHVGFTPSAMAHRAEILDRECERILKIEDRSVLQSQLELLLDRDPTHECIPLIVGLLGGAPLASTFDSLPAPASDNDDNIFTSADAGTSSVPY